MMRNFRITTLLASAALAATATFAVTAADARPAAKQQASAAETAAKLDAAIAGAHRSDAARARDQYRHPKETLLFFGLKPNMTVLEISPSAGWYTDIIAPVLNEKGRYIAAHNNPAGTPAQQKALANFVARKADKPDLFGRMAVTSFGKGIEGNLGAPNSVDMVFTFRNVHNWDMAGFAPQAFKSFYTVLKPGGVLGVVEHRMPESRELTKEARNSGYMKQSEVIRMAEEAGFKLVETSEINANPKDTADHKNGVWALPPTLANRDVDKDKYQAIGESDRMTLKFVKPAR